MRRQALGHKGTVLLCEINFVNTIEPSVRVPIFKTLNFYSAVFYERYRLISGKLMNNADIISNTRLIGRVKKMPQEPPDNTMLCK